MTLSVAETYFELSPSCKNQRKLLSLEETKAVIDLGDKGFVNKNLSGPKTAKVSLIIVKTL